MKEKIGIEKLIELYYEHKLDLLKSDMRGNGATEREIELADIEKVEEEELEENLNKLSDLKPFVKWLIENDKIDRDKNVLAFEFSSVYTYDGEDYEDHLKECKLLMLLAISDTPIEDLISYLK